MPFSEKMKTDVKYKAAFRCSRCHEIGVEVHHIVPQAEGGADTMENAAPLCPSCHAHFGDNPKKRKEITQMRDWWYEVAAEKYPRKDESALNERVLEVQRGEFSKRDELIASLQSEVNDLSTKLASGSVAQAPMVASGVVSATRIAEGVHANVRCSKCNSWIGMLVGANACPHCGAPIVY